MIVDDLKLASIDPNTVDSSFVVIDNLTIIDDKNLVDYIHDAILLGNLPFETKAQIVETIKNTIYGEEHCFTCNCCSCPVRHLCNGKF